jgi:glycosyltransferase involved in cell wall biosynthesis/SpoVK/Ycf46/Vps4 family AAA+-type ATPase
MARRYAHLRKETMRSAMASLPSSAARIAPLLTAEHEPAQVPKRNTSPPSSRAIRLSCLEDADKDRKIGSVTWRPLSILTIATEWRSGHGGISTFNRELCCALARLGHRVLCAVPIVTDDDREAAGQRGVTLVTSKPLPGSTDSQALSRPLQAVDNDVDIIIGHGRITGAAGVAQVTDRLTRARYVHFVHMDPTAIEWAKHRDDEVDATRTAKERLDVEVNLARHAALIVAVGPELHGAYTMHLHPFGRTVHLFLPGLFPSDWPASAPSGAAACLIFGRAEDAELKGVNLAVQAMRLVKEDRGPLEFARLMILGSPPGKGDALHAQLMAGSGSRVRITVEEFTPDADVVRRSIRAASLVLMPSLEEGFGLSGLEAISEGIPVLLSRTSGLAQAIGQHLPALAPLHVVDVREGASHLADRIKERLSDRETAFSQSRALRDAMRAHFDWDVAARMLSDELRALFDGNAKEPALKDAIPTSATEAIFASLASASAALLSWRQTLRTTDEWIERREFTTMMDYARSDTRTALVLLGPPGSGKSALMARAAQQLLEEKVTVLGIKADTIPNTVDSVSALAQELRLPSDLITAISSVARLQPTVLFIDQLDALADLVDLNTQRLTVLLELVTQLSAAGVRVVMSCRAFDFAHDTRFEQLAAQELRLESPDDAAIQGVLAANGAAEDALSPRLRELLRTPQLLDAFLELRAGGASTPAETQTQLLAQLWRTRLSSEEHGAQLAKAAETIATIMAEREELWLATSLLDGSVRKSVSGLLRAGLLIQRSESIAFVHQTMFEYARARAFASTGEALSSYVFRRQDALFVRPTLWTSLDYLRATDPVVYRREFDALWLSPNLRRHVRRLLWEYLGQRTDPTEWEVAYVIGGLADPAWRLTALSVTASNPAWFDTLKETTIPDLMSGADGHLVLEVIVNALRFAPAEATALIERFWRGDATKARPVATALVLTPSWSDAMEALALEVVSSGVLEDDNVDSLLHQATTARAAAGPRLIAAHLTCKLNALGPIAPHDDSEDALERMVAERARLEPFRDLIDRSGGLHFVIESAKAAPESFLASVWPWFVAIVRDLSQREPLWKTYRDDGTLGTSLRSVGGVHEMAAAIDSAIRAVAERDPEAIATFVRAWQAEETLSVHRFLMTGLRASLPTSSPDALEYLRGDSRRLVVGDYCSPDRETTDFIKALAPHIPPDQLPAVEQMLSQSSYVTVDGKDDPRWRRRALDENRQHQLRLLLALGRDRLSAARLSHVEQEERRFPDAEEDRADVVELVNIGSPISSEQMLRAKNEDILNLFEGLPDKTDWDHPFRRLQGGSIQASQELAEAAKKDPERFASLLHQFKPGVSERPVASVFRALGELVPLARLEDKLHALVAAGFFTTVEYRADAAWALHRASPEGATMRNETCRLLESWLCDNPANEEPREHHESDRGDSILFGMGGWGAYPEGNFPILLALTKGYLARPAPALESWLSALEQHLQRRESSAVWEALTSRLEYALPGDAARVETFFDRLFTQFPRVRDSRQGLILVARAIHHLSVETIERWVRDIEGGDWSRRFQGVGELLGLLVTRSAVPGWASSRVERELAALAAGTERTKGLVVGLTHAVAHLWELPERRARANDILVRVIPYAEGAVASAVLAVFRSSTKRVFWDEAATKLLTVLRDNPRVLGTDHGPWIIDRLREALPTRAELVADVTTAMVSELAKTETRGLLFSYGPELVDIALTLQRVGEATRVKGMDLFEQLLDLNAYGIRDVLAELDGAGDRSTRRARTVRRRGK